MVSNNRARRTHFVKWLPIVFFLLLSPALIKSFIPGQAEDQVKRKSKTELQVPQTESAAPHDSEFAKQIDKLIDESELAYARWGISVISLPDGTSIYRRDADKLFTPASNMKVYTTGVALDLLGPDYRWRTSVYATTQPDANGKIQGDLILYGRGAPDLVSNSKDGSRGSLSKLADDLYQRGIRRIDGNVIGDDSYFRGDPLGDGWQWTDIQWYFGAEASALSINGNEIDVNLVPSDGKEAPTLKVGDNEDQMTIRNRMINGKAGTRTTIGVHRGLSDNEIEVWGELSPGSKGFGARLSVHNPALWAAKLFASALKSRGIAIGGETQARGSREAPSQRFDPARAQELAAVSSQPLSDIIRKTNKESNNLYAELILRTLGRECGELVTRPEPAGRERGDDESGLAVMRLWLERAGIATARLALHDGSGLSRLDLVTPDTTSKLLLSYSKTGMGDVFKQSLPISGRDGTLGGRLKSIPERVLAKTGSLTYDNSLSGYLTTSGGTRLAFSIMCNDQTGRGDSIRLIDQIALLLGDYPNVHGQKGGKAQ